MCDGAELTFDKGLLRLAEEAETRAQDRVTEVEAELERLLEENERLRTDVECHRDQHRMHIATDEYERLHRIEEAARRVIAERDTYAAGSTMDRLRAALEEA